LATEDSEAKRHIPTAQQFGGPWSLIKADMVEKYMSFFNTALKNQSFKRIYIDAFAGSGAFRYVAPGSMQNSLFGPIDDNEHIHAGSAVRALRAQPPFDQIIFIEKDAANVAALQDLITRSGHKSARVIHGDSNSVLRELCRTEQWSNQRGVIFLDPFGMSVEWPTLEMIANTEALDVWLLFPLAGTIRNLPRLASQLDVGKREVVTRVLGTDEWFDKFYAADRNSMALEGLPPIVRRVASIDQIEAYVQTRFQTIFPHVEIPRRLKAPGNKSLFSLFFAVSNPRAVNVAVRGARHILTHA
jgi:three-Cys-motif partner protein